MRILLIEDTRDVGEAIVARLERIGHAVDWELDGAGAIDVIRSTAYDLVTLDVMLLRVDGFTIL
jgi:two-component system response regulator TctD